jgi:hypothetical protein
MATTSARPRAGKGRLFRIDTDGRVEPLMENDEGHFTRVQLATDGTIWAGVGKDGRIVRVGPDRASATYIDVEERQVLDLDMLGSEPIFVTGDAGAIYRVAPGRPADATWTSKVLDARFVARFGELVLRGTGTFGWQTRSGNTAEVDTTWSDFSASSSIAGPIHSPAGRFLQIRVRWPAQGDSTLRAVSAYYLPQNQRAFVRDVTLDPERTKQRDEPPAPSPRYKLVWKVDNPDEDRLRYRLRYRNEAQTVWRDMTRETETVTALDYTWETAAVPDGFYVVEVAASDELVNPESLTTRATALSEPLLVDNHPPDIEDLRFDAGRITGRAVDSLGPIARLEVAIDGGEWRVLFPADGLLDTAREPFEVDVSALRGDHIVSIRAYDAGGNSVTRETSTR